MKAAYAKFAATLLVSLMVMFALTMSMVRTLDHYYLNPANFYMAVIMVAPMGVIMLVAMWGMYRNRSLNVVLLALFAAIFAGALWLGRTGTFIGDEGFLRSMIPHHSRAILMCQESAITDPEIEQLCREIIEAQRREITEMKQILQRY